MIVPRRPTFQLIALFDLLIIVVFAQYLDVQDSSARQAAESDRKVAAIESERNVARSRIDELTAAVTRSEQSVRTLRDELAAAKGRADAAMTGFDSATDLIARWLGAQQKDVLKQLASASEKERAAAANRLAVVVDGGSREAARHVLTWGEMEKRVDLWQLHILETGVIRFSAPTRSHQFRAETAERFEEEMVRILRTLPDTKPLVLLLLSWEDVDLKTRNQTVRGLERATQRLRDETDRRSRFELGLLGFLPESSVQDPEQ